MFLAERGAQLESYLDKVVRHPRVGGAFDLIIFLDASDAGLEAAKSYIEARAADEKDSLLERATGAIMSIASASSSSDSVAAARGRECASSPPSLPRPPPCPPFSATGAIDAHLDLKVDPEYTAAVEKHSRVLAHLSHAVSAGDAVLASARAASSCVSDAGKALVQLGEHESRNANVVSSTRAAVSAAATGAVKQMAALGYAATGAVAPGAASPAADEARSAFESHQRALASTSDGTIAGMFATADINDPHGAFSSMQTSTAPTPSAPPMRSAETLHQVLDRKSVV